MNKWKSNAENRGGKSPYTGFGSVRQQSIKLVSSNNGFM
jgi:hypothetical protein